MARAFKTVARYLKLPAQDVGEIRGHSVRVGATQDLLVLMWLWRRSCAKDMEERAGANAVRGACDGVAGWDGAAGEGAGEGRAVSACMGSSLNFGSGRQPDQCAGVATDCHWGRRD